MTATIDKAGRLVIPKAIRDAAGLAPGTPLDVRYRQGLIEIEPAAADVRLRRKGRFLVAEAPNAPKLTREEVNRVIQGVRSGEL